MQAAATDRITNTTTTSTLPTIFDRLDEKGLSSREYFWDLPTTALWGTKYASRARTYIDHFRADCLSDSLAQYNLISPRALGEGQGTSLDDHPHADIRAGQAFMYDIYDSIRSNPAVWAKTAFVINYDEWGGFYDHVRPPRLRDSSDFVEAGVRWHGDNPDLATDTGQAGFRVPCFIVSPWSRPGYVGHRIYDHTSVLKMVEWRFGLRPLSLRDATANNLAEVLDFQSAPRLAPPAFALDPLAGYTIANTPACPQAVAGGAAAADHHADFEEWEAFRDKALADGWDLPL
jgi:phospholipase C